MFFQQGQPLLLGIIVDQTYDIGRIEDVHWNPWFSTEKYALFIHCFISFPFIFFLFLLHQMLMFNVIECFSRGSNKTVEHSSLLVRIGSMFSTLLLSVTTLDTTSSRAALG